MGMEKDQREAYQDLICTGVFRHAGIALKPLVVMLWLLDSA